MWTPFHTVLNHSRSSICGKYTLHALRNHAWYIHKGQKDSRVTRPCTLKLFTCHACGKLFHCISYFLDQYEIMHTQHESTEHRPSCNKIWIINSNDNTVSGHSENGLSFIMLLYSKVCVRVASTLWQYEIVTTTCSIMHSCVATLSAI